jgi:hypothetical protein
MFNWFCPKIGLIADQTTDPLYVIIILCTSFYRGVGCLNIIFDGLDGRGKSIQTLCVHPHKRDVGYLNN